MFCEGVEHLLRFLLDQLKCQNSGLSGLSSVEETGKSSLDGDNSHFIFGKKKSVLKKEA
jgi:hypothetical protein